jgi:peptidoglycan/LPS O-acetylase OafA/YrhL
MPLQKSRQQFHALDGLRGVAAVAVLERHGSELFGGSVLPNSYLAVDLFFALSGFVLAHAYEHRLAREMSVGGFMAARLLRLYPLYLLGLVAAATLAVLDQAFFNADMSGSTLAASIVLGLLFLPTPPQISTDAFAFPLVGPAWSLFYELVINALYALVIGFLTNRVLLAIVAAAGIALIASTVHYGTLDVGWSWDNFAGGFARVGFSFFAGVALYRCRPDGMPALRHIAWPCILGLVAVFAAPVPAWASSAFDLLAVFILFPLLVWTASGAAANVASIRLFSFLGTASYAVYVLHVPALNWLHKVWPKLSATPLEELAPWAGYAFVLLFVPLCWLLDQRFDAPVRRWVSTRFFGPRRERVAEARPL